MFFLNKSIAILKNSAIKKMMIGLFCLMLSALVGCTSTSTLKAPCPNYGASCAKKPINSWDYQSV